MAELKMALDSVRRTPRLVDEVVGILRDGIVTGRIEPGTQLLQTELAERLGVSRTPLREAIRTLEADGLVRISNSNRTVEVVAITSADLREMYQIREMLDGLSARLAAERGLSAEVESEARAVLEALGDSAEDFDPLARTRLHAQFHELIAMASGNSRLLPLLPLIRTSSAALHQPFTQNPGAVRLSLEGRDTTFAEVMTKSEEQHAEILAAVVARDGDRAEAAARAHIQRTIALAEHVDMWREVIARDAGGPAGVEAS
jgi:GntR family transcriptional regulator of vanillate catabolism